MGGDRPLLLSPCSYATGSVSTKPLVTTCPYYTINLSFSLLISLSSPSESLYTFAFSISHGLPDHQTAFGGHQSLEGGTQPL